jgi:hypothetical protein
MRYVAIVTLALGALTGCATKTGGLPPGSCVSDEDCFPGICGPEGQCLPQCNVDSDCPEDMICQQEVCVQKPAPRDAGTGGRDGGSPTGGDGGSAGGDGGTRAEACSQRDSRRACGPDRGTCRPGTQVCNGEFWGPCTGAVGPAEEQCDGLDHDCDGIPTNGETRSCYNGPPGTEGVGTCRAGTQTCVDGAWGSCTGAVEPQPGNCAQPSCTGGPNPGCECTIGENRACYSGPPGTEGVGICHAGSQTCLAAGSAAAWGPCQGERLPEAEQCDGQDHDCNGRPNDRSGGCVCTTGQTQSCYTGPPGTLGVGTCRAGTQQCVLVGGQNQWGACTGEVTPVPGDCDHPSCTGPDDPNPGCDCINGRTRSCYTGPAGTQDVGACRAGTQTCAGGAWGACAGQTLPGTTDGCVPPNASYGSYAAQDLTCDGQLSRHNPTAQPMATAPTGAPIAPPSGFTYALEVQPLDTVTFIGGAADVDGAGTFSYRWRILTAPQNNTAGLSGAPGATPNDYSSQQQPTLFAQLAGDYQVGVRARDSTGCEGDEAKVLVRVKPHTAVHIQLTWDRSVDVDLQLARGATTAFTLSSSATGACYWGQLNPDWGTIDPTLDIDDLAGCNPENINYGMIGGAQPPLNSTYAIYVHYYCNQRGHRFTSGTDTWAVCYEPTVQTTPVNATVKVFVDGQLAKIDGTTQDAVFTTSITNWQVWKPATLLYDGVWRVRLSTEPKSSFAGCAAGSGSSSCVCGQSPNSLDPYCGTGGAACRQRYP